MMLTTPTMTGVLIGFVVGVGLAMIVVLLRRKLQ
jgi:hypothetical protein